MDCNEISVRGKVDRHTLFDRANARLLGVG